MTAYHVIEWLIVGGVVGYAVWNFASRFVPGLRRNTRKSGGCSSCDSCGSCGTSATPAPGKSEHPVRFRSR